MISYLYYAVELFTQFMLDKEVIKEYQVEEILSGSWSTFKAICEEQIETIKEEDPVSKFYNFITYAIKNNDIWFENFIAKGEYVGTGICSPIGGYNNSNAVFAGYYDKNDGYLYLDKQGIWAGLQTFCKREDSNFQLSKTSLFNMLKERGLSESNDGKRNDYKVCNKGIKGRFIKLKFNEPLLNVLRESNLYGNGIYIPEKGLFPEKDN